MLRSPIRPYPRLQQWVTGNWKGGASGSGSSSGGGGFSGDHLPVSGACSCRARFFFFLLFLFLFYFFFLSFLPIQEALYAGLLLSLSLSLSMCAFCTTGIHPNQVCKYVGKASSEGDCQMAAAVNDFRRQFFLFLFTFSFFVFFLFFSVVRLNACGY